MLGDSIFHVHAKDTQIYAANLPQDRRARYEKVHRRAQPLLDFSDRRLWPRYGWWKEFISTLRMYGYDYVLSIEHEDSLMSPEEGLAKAAGFLNEIVIQEKPAQAWWV